MIAFVKSSFNVYIIGISLEAFLIIFSFVTIFVIQYIQCQLLCDSYVLLDWQIDRVC